jgi:hypothetical protein
VDAPSTTEVRAAGEHARARAHARAPAFLRRRPALYAAWIEWTGPRRRASRRIAAGLVIGVAVGAAALRGAPAAGLLASLRANLAALAIAAVVLAAMITASRRAALHAAAARDWTAALPRAGVGRRVESAARACAPAAVLLFAAAYGLLALAVAGASALDGALACGAAIAGAVAGCALALVRPIGVPLAPPPGSRYVPAGGRRAASHARPSLEPLSRWPLRAALVRARPQAAARTALPLLLLMPAGLSAGQAAALLAGAGGLLVAGVVAAATLEVSLHAGR